MKTCHDGNRVRWVAAGLLVLGIFVASAWIECLYTRRTYSANCPFGKIIATDSHYLVMLNLDAFCDAASKRQTSCDMVQWNLTGVRFGNGYESHVTAAPSFGPVMTFQRYVRSIANNHYFLCPQRNAQISELFVALMIKEDKGRSEFLLRIIPAKGIIESQQTNDGK